MKKKPVEQMQKADKRTLRKAKKAYTKQKLKNRKHLFGRKRAPKG